MPKLILLLAIGLTAWLSWHQIKRLPPEARKRMLIQIGFWAIVVVILLAVFTGKLHWAGAVVAFFAGIAKALLPKAIRFAPFLWNIYKGKNKDKAQSTAQNDKIDTEISEAYAILGLKPGASRVDVIEAHRKKMQKAHPDKGGDHDYASQLNAAKSLLLKHIDIENS